MYDWIPEEHLTDCLSYFHVLMRAKQEWLDADVHGNAHAGIIETCVKALKFLEANIQRHVQIPMAICGNTDLEAKAKAIVQPMFVQTPDIPTVLRFASRVVSICTHRGTEMGLADAEGGSIKRYLPPWAATKRAISSDSGVAANFAEVAYEPQQKCLFPKGLLSTGVVHCVHNLEKDMDKQLKTFPSFLPKLKSLCHLFVRGDLMEQFSLRCFPGSAFASADYLFKEGLQAHAEWRWGTIIKMLKYVMRRRPALQHSWDPVKLSGTDTIMTEDTDGKKKRLDLAELTRTIRSSAFGGICRMLLAVHTISDGMRDWAEACPCHAWRADNTEQSSEFVAALAKVYGASNTPCIMNGRRAVELANGMFLKFFKALADVSGMDMLDSLPTLEPHDKALILADVESARALILFELQTWLGL